MSILHEAEGWRVRLATREDGPRLCSFLAGIPMEGAITLAQERDPDFFAALDATLAHCETFLAESDEGALVGCGTYAIRDAYMPDGSLGKVGHIADLRVAPAWRGARLIPTLGRVALERARAMHGVDVFTTAVMDANRRVVGTAKARSPARARQPVSRPITPYWLASVRPGGAGDARVAVADDLDEIAGFLDAGQRARLFGEPVTRKTLERRLDAWPGLRSSPFLVVRDAGGRMVGCGAPWSAAPIRRYRVHAYAGALGLVARVLGLPRPGGVLHTVTLSHLEVASSNALASILAASRRLARGAHLVNAFVPRGGPLARALPFGTTRTPMTLYVTMLHDSPWKDHDLSTARPGFEMALA